MFKIHNNGRVMVSVIDDAIDEARSRMFQRGDGRRMGVRVSLFW